MMNYLHKLEVLGTSQSNSTELILTPLMNNLPSRRTEPHFLLRSFPCWDRHLRVRQDSVPNIPILRNARMKKSKASIFHFWKCQVLCLNFCFSPSKCCTRQSQDSRRRSIGNSTYWCIWESGTSLEVHNVLLPLCGLLPYDIRHHIHIWAFPSGWTFSGLCGSGHAPGLVLSTSLKNKKWIDVFSMKWQSSQMDIGNKKGSGGGVRNSE